MILFAHNGVDHGGAKEAVNHAATSTFLTLLFITLGVILLVTLTVYLINRFTKLDLLGNKRK